MLCKLVILSSTPRTHVRKSENVVVCIHYTRAPAARREVETECPSSPHQLPWSIQQSRDKKAFSLSWKERTKFQELSSDLHMSIVVCMPYPHTDSNSKIKKNKSGPQVSKLVNMNLPAVPFTEALVSKVMTLAAVGGTELQVQHRRPKADPSPPTWFPSCSLLSLCFFLSCCEFILFSTKFT